MEISTEAPESSSDLDALVDETLTKTEVSKVAELRYTFCYLKEGFVLFDREVSHYDYHNSKWYPLLRILAESPTIQGEGGLSYKSIVVEVTDKWIRIGSKLVERNALLHDLQMQVSGLIGFADTGLSVVQAVLLGYEQSTGEKIMFPPVSIDRGTLDLSSPKGVLDLVVAFLHSRNAAS